MFDYKNMIITNLNLDRDNENHVKLDSCDGKIFSKEIGIKFDIKDIHVEIDDEINISFEMDNTDYRDLTTYNNVPGRIDEYVLEKMTEPREFKSIVIEFVFKDYHVELMEFSATEIFYKTIKNPKISGKCFRCKLTKNNNQFQNTDRIKIWDVYGEYGHISNFFCLKFENPILEDKIMISKNRNCPQIEIDLNKTFEEIFPYNWFIFQETIYGNYLQEHEKFIDNVNRLLSFYASNILHSRITIIESQNKEKLEILYLSKNIYKLNGVSIFHWHPNNFVKFLDTSYTPYLNLKNQEFDVDLLIHYYIWFKNEVYLDVKHLLGSIFLEVLIKQYFSERDRTRFSVKLKNILEEKLQLDISKLFDYLESGLSNILNEINLNYLNDLGRNEEDIEIVLSKFKKYFFIEIFTKYRNKNVHTGEIRLNGDDLMVIVDNSLNNLKNELNNSENVEIFEILENNKNMLVNSYFLSDLKTQNIVLENLMDIILLKLLSTDSQLILYLQKQKSINSKEYIELFSK